MRTVISQSAAHARQATSEERIRYARTRSARCQRRVVECPTTFATLHVSIAMRRHAGSGIDACCNNMWKASAPMQRRSGRRCRPSEHAAWRVVAAARWLKLSNRLLDTGATPFGTRRRPSTHRNRSLASAVSRLRRLLLRSLPHRSRLEERDARAMWRPAFRRLPARCSSSLASQLVERNVGLDVLVYGLEILGR